jgi:hypothetical protein
VQPSQIFNLGGTLEIIFKSQETTVLPITTVSYRGFQKPKPQPCGLTGGKFEDRFWVLSLQINRWWP